jgi:hypothetical protein
MRDRGSVSFVVEVKKRRWASPQGLMCPTGGDGKHETSTTAVAPRSFFVLPSEPRPISDPTAEAARAAADRLFSGAPRQTPATDEASTAAAPAPAPPADAPTPSSEPPAADVAASATVSVTPPVAEQPRTGRILASLIGEDPIAALMRQKTEEEARQRRVRRALRASMAPASDTPASAADESKPATRVRGKAKVKRDALASSGATATPSGEEAGTTITTDPRATRRKARTAKTKGRQHAAAGRTARARTGAKRNARKLTAKAGTATKAAAKKAAAKKAVAKRAKAKATTAQPKADRKKASARTRAQTKALSSRKTAGRTGAAAKRSAKAAASRKNAKGGGVRKGAATARKGAAARKRRTL